MEAVTNLLSNPVIKQGLRMAAPEIALGVDLGVTIVGSLFRGRKKEKAAKRLLVVIDSELAKVLETLATTKSKHMRKECEIRVHTLLGVLNEWDKIS